MPIGMGSRYIPLAKRRRRLDIEEEAETQGSRSKSHSKSRSKSTLKKPSKGKNLTRMARNLKKKKEKGYTVKQMKDMGFPDYFYH